MWYRFYTVLLGRVWLYSVRHLGGDQRKTTGKEITVLQNCIYEAGPPLSMCVSSPNTMSGSINLKPQDNYNYILVPGTRECYFVH